VKELNIDGGAFVDVLSSPPPLNHLKTRSAPEVEGAALRA
jgi:hypothetical protein